MLWDSMIFSVRNIGRKKFRSIFTIISIAIGVASVVLIASIGEIGKSTILNELENLGLGSLTITSDYKRTNLSLNADDLEFVRNNEAVDSAIPVMVEYTDSKMRGLIANTIIWGTDNGAKQVISLEPKYGRIINKQDVASGDNICVVDEKLVLAFYKRDNIVGKKINIKLSGGFEEFEIVGVVKSGGNILQNMLGEIIPSFIYLPYTTMQRLSGRDHFDQIAVKLSDKTNVDVAGEQLIAALNHKAGIKTGYKAENIAKQKNNLTNLLNIVTLVLSAIAGISLVVAGLGIMTVMLVSVNERTREIGIKKAIGASKLGILVEFLVEAFTISAIGSIIGTSFSVLIVTIGCMILGIQIVFQTSLIIFCLTFSVIIGVIFGAYPALLAAKMRPVDALRFE